MLKQLPSFAASLFTLGFFYFFARPGILNYFTDDDVMNMRAAWSLPWGKLAWQMLTFAPDAYRPVGLLMYKTMFALAGLHPRPFHWVAFGFLAINLLLLFLVARNLAQSTEVAILAVLIGCFHSRMDPLYSAFASIYDIVCFSCYFTLFFWYIRIRKHPDRPIGAATVFGFVALNAIALNAKEPAVTLPVMILAYEMLFHSVPSAVRKLPAWLFTEGRVLLASTLLTAVFCFRKLHGATSLNSAYHPQFSLARLLENWQSYLGPLLYRLDPVPMVGVAAIWVILIGVAFTSNSRVLKFCCALIFLGTLPMFVVEPRNLGVLYIPLTGLWIYVAYVLVCLRVQLLQSLGVRFASPVARASVVVLFLVCAALLGLAHVADRPNRFVAGIGKSVLVQDFKTDFARLHPSFKHDAVILFLDDPFGTDEWTPVSLLQLYYRNPDLNILRAKLPDQREAAAHTRFDFVFTYEGGHMKEVANPIRKP